MNKYGAKKTELDGIVFDSRKEANRYAELKLMQRAGQIHDLKIQVPFELIPKQEEDGRIVERPVKYVADFVYFDNSGMVVEDAKGMKTDVYKLKKKMMRWLWGIEVREV